MLRIVKRLVQLTVFGLFLVVAFVLLRSDPTPFSKAEVDDLVTHLNEAAAIGVPHDFLMRKEVRVENLSLLQKVEDGSELTRAESIAYRNIFQQALAENQQFLGRFDAELAVLADHAMETPNNVQGLGIAGQHDHHDLSARRNFAQVLTDLTTLKAATSTFGRIRWANAAQKDLIDLISHIGVVPHTVSVPYLKPDKPWADDELGTLFEAYLMLSKQAQMVNVNTQDYWVAEDQALAQYSALILAVQNRIMAQTLSFERRIAGRFNAIQTFAPPVDLTRPLRRK